MNCFSLSVEGNGFPCFDMNGLKVWLWLAKSCWRHFQELWQGNIERKVYWNEYFVKNIVRVKKNVADHVKHVTDPVNVAAESNKIDSGVRNSRRRAFFDTEKVADKLIKVFIDPEKVAGDEKSTSAKEPVSREYIY